MLFQAFGKGFRNKGFRSKITNPKQHQSSKAVVLRSPVEKDVGGGKSAGVTTGMLSWW